MLSHFLGLALLTSSPPSRTGLLGNVLVLAHSCGINLSDLYLKLDRTLPVPAASSLPPFILEWLHDANRLCCARRQIEGEVSWQPNAMFTRMIGDEAALLAKLKAQQSDITAQVDFQTCIAEMFLATPLHEDDQTMLPKLNGALWSSMVEGPDGTRQAEATAPQTVRCMLQLDAGTPPEYVSCWLSGRTVVHADSREVNSAFSLTPILPPATSGAAADAVDSPMAPLAWPVSELEEAMLEEKDLTYEVLSALGLNLEPDDEANALPMPVLDDAF